MNTFLASIVACSLATSVLAADIPVKPGTGTLTIAAGTATEGDVLVLEKGEYRDAVTLSAGVTLRGAGAGESVLIATGRFAVQCDGEGVTVNGLTIKGDGETLRGINTMSAVRIERVRFENIKEAVALMGAPLSDVVHCDFIDCGIGVRAIAESSPTVWGCRFKGGNLGVLAIGGSPYVRHCVFDGVSEGCRVSPGGSPMIRNNLFVDCPTAVILLSSKDDSASAWMRNNVYVRGTSALVGTMESVNGLTHSVVHGLTGPIVANDSGSAVGAPAATVVEADTAVTVADDGTINWGTREALDGKGVAAGGDAADARRDIGPQATLTKVGAAAPADAESPPVRFRDQPYIANSVSEEYQALRMWRLRSSEQSMKSGPEGPTDTHDTGGKEIVFNIARFFSESSR